MASKTHQGKPKDRRLKKTETMDRFLAIYAQGELSIKKACAAVGRTEQWYYMVSKEHPDFAAKMDALRLRLKSGATVETMDFVTFRQVHFNHSTAPHHLRMIEAIQRALPDTITLILAFPEAAKTTVLIDYICYCLALNPNLRNAVISEGHDLAKKIVSHVATRMTDETQFNSYITQYGPFKAEGRDLMKPWSTNALSLLLARNDEKDFSLEARGAGSTLYGGRFDEIFLDDLQSEGNLNQTTKLLRYLRQTVLTRPAKGVGKTTGVGSRVGEGDIYEKMVDEGMVDYLIPIPALTVPVSRDEHFYEDGKKIIVNPDCKAEPTWDYWSLEDLAKRRKKVGEEIWARTYMQQTVVSVGATFTEKMIQDSKDFSRKRAETNVGTDIMCAIDPALDSGVCAFLAVAYSQEKMWILDCLESSQMHSGEDILNMITLWSSAYRPSTWIVEQNAFQKTLVRDERLRAISEKFRFTVMPHNTARNKNDPVLGVRMMSAAFSDKEISIPWGDDETIQRMGPLIDELRAWRPHKLGGELKQDLVMAPWFLWRKWEENRKVMNLEMPNIFTDMPSWYSGAA